MQPIQRVEAYAWSSLAVIALVVVATIVLVQFVKPIFRARVQRRLTDAWPLDALLGEPRGTPDWLRAAVVDAGLIETMQQRVSVAIDRSRAPLPPSTGTLARGLRRPSIGNAVHMRMLQSEALARLEAPLDDPHRYALMTAGAPEQDRIAGLYLHALRQLDPARLAALAERRDAAPGDQASLIVAGIRSNLAAAVDRNLDALQLRLGSAWRWWGRGIALAAGVGIAMLLGLGAGVVAPGFIAAMLLASALPLLPLGTIALIAWIEDRVSWGIPSWLGIALLVLLPLGALLLGIWGLVAVNRSITVAPAQADVDLIVVGLIAGGIASVVYDWGRALAVRRT